MRGRVLDVGGGGRVCLHLQEHKLEVVGIDSSPGAVDACIERGVQDVRHVSVEAVDASLGRFDTIVFLGQNFGMVGSAARCRRILRRLELISTERGRIVAECFDPHHDHDAVHAAYRRQNTAHGRMPGQLRVRLRYRHMASAWHDWAGRSPVSP